MLRSLDTPRGRLLWRMLGPGQLTTRPSLLKREHVWRLRPEPMPANARATNGAKLWSERRAHSRTIPGAACSKLVLYPTAYVAMLDRLQSPLLLITIAANISRLVIVIVVEHTGPFGGLLTLQLHRPRASHQHREDEALLRAPRQWTREDTPRQHQQTRSKRYRATV